MRAVKTFIQYKEFDFILTITEYNSECDIIEYDIELDYGFAEPFPADDIARMIIAMLADGTHLKEKILDHAIGDLKQWNYICDDIIETINEEARDYVDGEGDYRYEMRMEDLI